LNHSRGISNSVFRSLLFLLVFSVGASAQSPATPIAVNLTPSTTNIHWTLNTTIHTVHGTFKLKSGDFKIDPATGNVNGLIVIDATSGESGDSSRDKRMHAAILESPKYPTITFRPVRVEGKIDLAVPGQVTVHGILNLHGQDHPLDLIVTLHPQGTAVALTTHFAVPFVAWGLKDPSTFVFRTDKEVILDVDATITPFYDPARPR
jgi:polyisoprenoid-binding protein YceI